MTHFSDGIRVGAAGLTGETRQVNAQPGAPSSPVFVYDIVPAAISTNNIAAAATLSGAPASFTISGATGTTTTTINGVSYVDLGVARTINASGASTATVSTDITVVGLDDYLQPLTQTFSGPVSTVLTSTTKTFRYVRSATTSGNTVGTVALGTGDVFGFPYRVNNFGYARITWNNIGVTSSAGFTAPVTTTATVTTGDVRGTYAVQSTASDGTRRLTAFLFLKDTDTQAGLYGVSQA